MLDGVLKKSTIIAKNCLPFLTMVQNILFQHCLDKTPLLFKPPNSHSLAFNCF